MAEPRITLNDISDLLARAQRAVQGHHPVLAVSLWSAIESIRAGEIEITVPLNVFDDEHVVVDTTSTTLSLPAISDIIDHAAQFALEMDKAPPVFSQQAATTFDELTEALSTYGVIA